MSKKAFLKVATALADLVRPLSEKRLTKEDVLEHLCVTMGIVYKTIGDYSKPSDGFCRHCPNHDSPESFRHAGETLAYVRRAVINQLKADGYKIAKGFDPDTGEETKTTTTETERHAPEPSEAAAAVEAHDPDGELD